MDDEVFGRCPHCGFGFRTLTSVDPKGPRVLPGVHRRCLFLRRMRGD